MGYKTVTITHDMKGRPISPRTIKVDPRVKRIIDERKLELANSGPGFGADGGCVGVIIHKENGRAVTGPGARSFSYLVTGERNRVRKRSADRDDFRLAAYPEKKPKAATKKSASVSIQKSTQRRAKGSKALNAKKMTATLSDGTVVEGTVEEMKELFNLK